ncbi:Peptidase family M20/M25/M40, partial [Dethiosulfatibacter aminovorans DSM 17477]
IRIGNQIYTALQGLTNSEVDAKEPVILAVTKFNAGSANNVIPDKIEIGGSIRTTTLETNERMPVILESVVKGISDMNGSSYELRYKPFCIPLISDDAITDLVKDTVIENFGESNVVLQTDIIMGGDDFSYFSREVPSTYFMVGTLNRDKGLINKPHNPYFNIDESILFKTSLLFADIVLNYLNGK